METVFKQFVSEKQVEEVKKKRQEEWEKVRRPDQPLGKYKHTLWSQLVTLISTQITRHKLLDIYFCNLIVELKLCQ